MRFDDLDSRMRIFETADDYCVLPGIHIVVRLDGRGYTRMTKEVWRLEAPYDTRFRDIMLDTTAHLMDCGFNVVYGYTQSDEISLLLDLGDNTFSRKTRKILSVLAGEASAHFSVAMAGLEGGSAGVFDSRICQLPNAGLVRDYFRWRHEDAHRNALNAHGYWLLRKQGEKPQAADARLAGLSVAEKNELLFQHGINFNDLPAWQKRGRGVYWESYEKPAVNPKTGEAVSATRRRLKHDLELPMGEAYDAFIEKFLAEERL